MKKPTNSRSGKRTGITADEAHALIQLGLVMFEGFVMRAMEKSDKLDQKRDERRYVHEVEMESLREKRDEAREVRASKREEEREARFQRSR
jgi:hypothetical protein